MLQIITLIITLQWLHSV